MAILRKIETPTYQLDFHTPPSEVFRGVKYSHTGPKWAIGENSCRKSTAAYLQEVCDPVTRPKIAGSKKIRRAAISAEIADFEKSRRGLSEIFPGQFREQDPN
jgi:hypothetical protein